MTQSITGTDNYHSVPDNKRTRVGYFHFKNRFAKDDVGIVVKGGCGTGVDSTRWDRA